MKGWEEEREKRKGRTFFFEFLSEKRRKKTKYEEKKRKRREGGGEEECEPSPSREWVMRWAWGDIAEGLKFMYFLENIDHLILHEKFGGSLVVYSR